MTKAATRALTLYQHDSEHSACTNLTEGNERVWRGSAGFRSTRGIQGTEEEEFKNGKAKSRPEYRDDECHIKAPDFTLRP